LLMYSRKKGIRYWAYTYELPARHRGSDELCSGGQACLVVDVREEKN
jgi:hypothetical protein